MSYPMCGLVRGCLEIWQNNSNNKNRSITLIQHIKSIPKYFLITTFVGSLSACITNGTGTPEPGTLSGSVGDGPVTLAKVDVSDPSGTVILSTNSDLSANYKVTLPTDTTFPVILTSSGGTDIVTGAEPGFNMVTAALQSSMMTANINPFTTIIVKSAQNMSGGLTSTNLALANNNMLSQLGFGLDTQLVSEPINSPVTKVNVAAMVKASEALGETVRRTQSALTVSGANYSQDDLIDAVAKDMVDGVLDGQGATGSSPKIAATFNVVAGQVLVETLSNHLNVDNADATDYLDIAIKVTEPTSSVTTADVAITDQMLSQTKIAVSAAEAIAPSTSLSAMANILDGVSGNSTAADIEKVLPASMSSDFNDAIAKVVAATDVELEAVNNAIRSAASASSNSGSTDTTGGNTSGGTSGGTDTTGDNTGGSTSGGTTTTGDNTSGGTTGGGTTGGNTGGGSSTGNSSTTVIRVNVGGSDYTDSKGDLWAADTGFNTGTASKLSGTVAGTNDPLLYQANRWDATASPELAYAFDVPNGTYTVNLYFLDFFGSAGMRVFDVLIQNQVVQKGLDIYSEAGNYTALKKSFQVNVVDGKLYIQLNHGIEDPTISAIEILGQTKTTTITTDNNTSVNVDVLGGMQGQVKIMDAPAHGQATVNTDGSISYVPDGTFGGTDSITYEIIGTDGNITVATVVVEVSCNTCATDVALNLNWNPNPDTVVGYKVYSGPTMDAVTEISDLVVGSGVLLDSSSPAVKFMASKDLGLKTGDHVCFKVQAYNNVGASDLSDAVCTDI